MTEETAVNATSRTALNTLVPSRTLLVLVWIQLPIVYTPTSPIAAGSWATSVTGTVIMKTTTR